MAWLNISSIYFTVPPPSQKLPQSLHFLNKKPYLCAAKKSLTTYGFEGNAALNLAVYESLTHHITPSAQAGFYGEFAA